MAQLGDLLSLAEAKLKTPGEELLRSTSLDTDPSLAALFASLDEADPAVSPAEEAAALAAWIVRNLPFPKYNREIAEGFMRMMLGDGGLPWPESEEHSYGTERAFEALEAGAISEAEFADWVCLRVEVGKQSLPPKP